MICEGGIDMISKPQNMGIIKNSKIVVLKMWVQKTLKVLLIKTSKNWLSEFELTGEKDCPFQSLITYSLTAGIWQRWFRNTILLPVSVPRRT